MERVSAAWVAGDYEALRELLHPEGVWFLVSASSRMYFDPDEFVDAIRDAREHTVYEFNPMTHDPLGARVLLGSCFIRTPIPAAGVGHNMSRYTFLLEVRDGLFFRSETFASEQEARSAFLRGWGRPEIGSIVAP